MTKLSGRPIFVLSERTQTVVKVLRGVNEDIAYSTLANIVGFPITGASTALISARRVLESTENIVFETIRGEGLRRLDDAGKVASTSRHVRTIGRAARRGRKRLGTINDFATLPPAGQLQATLRATQFEFAQQAVSTKPVAPPVANSKLDLAAAVKALR